MLTKLSFIKLLCLFSLVLLELPSERYVDKVTICFLIVFNLVSNSDDNSPSSLDGSLENSFCNAL